LIIVAGVLTTFKQRWVRVLAISLAVASLSLIWEQYFYPGGALAILDLVLKLIFVGLLLAVLSVQVFKSGPVTAHRIRGAIVVYLLLGGAWSLLYSLVHLTTPHAFHLARELAAGDTGNIQRSLTYFSFITLTTTGFGDITPTNALSRTLAMFEAMTGQLYLVITMARLVSQAIVCQKDNSPEKKQ
ncbi:MAG: potassium channel family protein, partial [Syntrophales bacterium]|nr:potassium channel family protein [Syntrophales bacterium]